MDDKKLYNFLIKWISPPEEALEQFTKDWENVADEFELDKSLNGLQMESILNFIKAKFPDDFKDRDNLKELYCCDCKKNYALICGECNKKEIKAIREATLTEFQTWLINKIKVNQLSVLHLDIRDFNRDFGRKWVTQNGSK